MALVVYILVLLGTLQSVSVSAGEDCEPFYKNGRYQWKQSCPSKEHCCGSCDYRFCCSSLLNWLSEHEQERCDNNNNDFNSDFGRDPGLPTFFKILIPLFVIFFVVILIYLCYKKCNSPTPVVATTTHTTVVASTQYPSNPTTVHQHPGFYPGNQQPGYGTPAPYGGQPMPSVEPQGPANTAFGPPPSYQDVAGAGGYPVNYGGAAFPPGQQSYPASADLNAQPAYNPDYAAPPPAKY
ncbi:protein shisa-5-like [Engraulis encrasicolus]|uniref:protein shisa-5-like n=1 Tax=Engraulis encrasicolus TaxID=184585 RepID=UPI002FD710CE